MSIPILVTGYGSIGSIVTKRLLQKGHGVLVIDRSESAIYQARSDLKTYPEASYRVGDVTDPSTLNYIRQVRPEHVIHTAAMKHVTFCEESPSLAAQNNIFGTQNLVDLAREMGVSSFVNVSTDKSAYPVNVMGATKFIAEKIVTNAGYNSVRLGNVLNSNGSFIPTIRKYVNRGLTLDITDLNATRFYITPIEAAEFIIQQLNLDVNRPAKVGLIVVKKLASADVQTMLDATFDQLGKRCEIKVSGLRPGEKLHEHLYSGAEAARMEEHTDEWWIYPNQVGHQIEVIDSSQFKVDSDTFKQALSNASPTLSQ